MTSPDLIRIDFHICMQMYCIMDRLQKKMIEYDSILAKNGKNG